MKIQHVSYSHPNRVSLRGEEKCLHSCLFFHPGFCAQRQASQQQDTAEPSSALCCAQANKPDWETELDLRLIAAAQSMSELSSHQSAKKAVWTLSGLRAWLAEQLQSLLITEVIILHQVKKKKPMNQQTILQKAQGLLKHLLGSGEEIKCTQHVHHQTKVTPLWRFVTEISLLWMKYEWKWVCESTRENSKTKVKRLPSTKDKLTAIIY